MRCMSQISLSTDVPTLDTCRLPNPWTALPQANSLAEVRFPRSACASATLSLSRPVTIGKLSDSVLLNIFCYYLEVSPRYWPTLLHRCRQWRHIAFASQRALHIRLFCTHGTPVLRALVCWSTLPIVMTYGGSPALDMPVPDNENDVMAALKQSDRVRSLSVTVTNSLLKKTSSNMVKRPFSELEDLVLLSRDDVRLTLPIAFRWDPRLRLLHLTRIDFPAFLQLPYSSRNLVDLQLHEVLDPCHFSPEDLTNALSEMAQLRSLSLYLLSTANYVISPPFVERVVLPSLTRLNFRGITRHLEDLVARIDTPPLEDIEVTLINKFVFDLSKLGEFINRIEMHKSHRRADILSSERSFSISFIQPGAPTCIKLQLFHESLNVQLTTVTRICTHLSAALSNVEDLRIKATRPPGCTVGLDIRRWLEPINLFPGVKWLHVAGNLSTDIMHALQLPERHKTVLPTLHKFSISRPVPYGSPLRRAVVSFMTSRRLSDRPIEVEYERLSHTSKRHVTGIIHVRRHRCYLLTRV